MRREFWQSHDCSGYRCRVSIDWGVTGVPETFVIDGDGMIRAHYAGPLSQEILNRVILPAVDGAGG